MYKYRNLKYNYTMGNPSMYKKNKIDLKFVVILVNTVQNLGVCYQKKKLK